MSAALAAILLLVNLPGQQPRLTLTDRRLEPGATVRLTGSGFQSGTRPTIALEGARDTVELGFAAPAADGGIEVSLDIPRSVAAGAWRLVARSHDAVLAVLDVAVLEAAAGGAVTPGGTVADSASSVMSARDMSASPAVSGGGRILGYDWPLLHAALNDLPSALLVFAENRVAHDDVAHEVMNRHKLLALAAFALFALLLAWRLIRRDAARRERMLWVGSGAVAAGLLIAASQLGGALVFEHALGVPSPTLHTVLERRGDMPAMAMPDSGSVDSTARVAPARPHTDRPGSAPHSH